MRAVIHSFIQPFSQSKSSRTLLLSINARTIEELPEKKLKQQQQQQQQTFKLCKSNILFAYFRSNSVTCLFNGINTRFC